MIDGVLDDLHGADAVGQPDLPHDGDALASDGEMELRAVVEPARGQNQVIHVHQLAHQAHRDANGLSLAAIAPGYQGG